VKKECAQRSGTSTGTGQGKAYGSGDRAVLRIRAWGQGRHLMVVIGAGEVLALAVRR
jgi:hypothetical protein